MNRSVSFHVIQGEALDLLLGDLETGPLLERLTALFLTNPSPATKGAKPAPDQAVRQGLAGFSQATEKALLLNGIPLT